MYLSESNQIYKLYLENVFLTEKAGRTPLDLKQFMDILRTNVNILGQVRMEPSIKLIKLIKNSSVENPKEKIDKILNSYFDSLTSNHNFFKKSETAKKHYYGTLRNTLNNFFLKPDETIEKIYDNLGKTKYAGQMSKKEAEDTGEDISYKNTGYYDEMEKSYDDYMGSLEDEDERESDDFNDEDDTDEWVTNQIQSSIRNNKVGSDLHGLRIVDEFPYKYGKSGDDLEFVKRVRHYKSFENEPSLYKNKKSNIEDDDIEDDDINLDDETEEENN
jgi:hypothetical protein